VRSESDLPTGEADVGQDSSGALWLCERGLSKALRDLLGLYGSKFHYAGHGHRHLFPELAWRQSTSVGFRSRMIASI